jgi:AraC-like DNA-binding protein
LNLLDLRDQSWVEIQMGAHSGYQVRASEAVFCHAMLEGKATISGLGACRIRLETGDVVFSISGGTHFLRTHARSPVHDVEALNTDDDSDTLQQVRLDEPVAARVLCGRLKVVWPGGLDQRFMPSQIGIDGRTSMIDLDLLAQIAVERDTTALLRRAATLLLTAGLRDHPQCDSIFRATHCRDPVSCAIQIMELHPHQTWTVAGLAEKVGMGRSTFARRFLDQIGKPPMEVFTDIRMQQAARLLTHTQLKVAEIGERVGYRSESRFINRFESHFNITPGKMRAERMLGGKSIWQTLSSVPALRSAGRI